MNKLYRLVSVQLFAVITDMLSIGKNKKKNSKAHYAGLIAFILFMSALSFFYNMMFGFGLQQFKSLQLLPAMIMSVTCVVVLVTTVFKVKGTIFGFRDYDLIMSLPVSNAAIVGSRLVILYALNFMFIIIIMIPMIIAYGILAKPGIPFYITSIITLFFVPMVPIVIASLLGTLIAYVSSKFKHSNILNLLFTFLFLILIFGASFTIKGNGQEIVNSSNALTKQVYAIYPLARMYRDAVVFNNIPELLLFIGISIAAFVLFTLVVKQLFKKINTQLMTGSYHVNYKMGQLKTSSPIKALYFKELKRYFSSTIYVMNAGFGIVMLTVGAIALIFVDINKVLGGSEEAAQVIKSIPVGITFCIAMTCTTMSSISLEGKNLWIIKSMPIPPKTVYLSKIAVNLTILLPAVIDTIIIGAVLKINVPEMISLILVTAACSVFTAFYGLVINLLMPNFNWTSEIAVVKQSPATLVTIFSAIGYVALQFVFMFLLPTLTLALLGYFALTVVIDGVLYYVLMHYGSRRYQEL